MKQYVYSFKEGNKDMRVILGGKGANLAEMTSIGLPVPQGFTVSTEACTAYYEDGKQISPEICAQIDNKLAELEAETGKKLGDPTNPLLVSVRSGARESMPGMMDTVLNLGLNDEVATGFTKITNNERFVYDSYQTHDLFMTVIGALFKCLQMLLWDFQKAHLKENLMISKKKKELNLIQI